MVNTHREPTTPYMKRVRISTFTRRVPTAIGYLFSLTRSPARLLDLGRTLGGVILDDQLNSSSPIKELPQLFRDSFGRHEITLPSPALFQPGNQDLAGLVHIVSVARALSVVTIFEIGTFNGRTALTLAMNLPEAMVYTLDLPPDGRPQLQVAGHDHFLLNQPVSRVYEGRSEAQRIVQLFGDSATFDFSPYARRCQLVYVDGAHSLEYLENDTEVAFRIVDDRAAIIWDDYWRPAEGVVRYLNSRNKNLRLYRLPASRLVLWLSDCALDWLMRDSASPRGALVSAGSPD